MLTTSVLLPRSRTLAPWVGSLQIARCFAQFINSCANWKFLNCAICLFAQFRIAPRKLEISNLRNYLKTALKFINCARRIAQIVNSDLGLVPQPRTHVAWLVPRPRSLAAVTQLGRKLHYSPAAVIQPPLSLRRSRSRIQQRSTALINYARELTTVAGLSLTLAFTLGS